MPEVAGGFCYLFPIDGSGTEHLHICVTGPVWFPSSVVVVKVLTWRPLRAPEDYFELRVGDHPFIGHLSQADLHGAMAIHTEIIAGYLASGLAVADRSANLALRKRLAAALLASPRTKREVKRLLQAAPV